MLEGYFDDSGTHRNSRVVVWAGFIGDEVQWSRLDSVWEEKLANPLPGKPAIKRFHMSHCEAGTEEFAGYSRAERDRVIHDFRQIIIDVGVVGRATAVQRDEWDRLVQGLRRSMFGDAEMYCFRGCLSDAIKMADQNVSSRTMSLTFDKRDGGERSITLDSLANEFKNFYNGNLNRTNYPYIYDISFRSSMEIRALQAADMLAWETYNVALNQIGKNDDEPVQLRPHIRSLCDTGRISAGFMDTRAIESLVRMIGVQSPHG